MVGHVCRLIAGTVRIKRKKEAPSSGQEPTPTVEDFLKELRSDLATNKKELKLPHMEHIVCVRCKCTAAYFVS